MLLEFIENRELANIINNIIVVLFLCGFLISYKNRRINPSVFIFSAIQLANITFASNVFNDYIAHVFVSNIEAIAVKTFYLDMIRDDLLTITVIIFIHLFLRIKISKVTKIAVGILLFNSLFYSFMHVDIVILQHKAAPWFWWDNFYTIAINFSEVLVASIIVFYGYKVRKTESVARCNNGI